MADEDVFYRGTSRLAADEIVESQAFDATRIAEQQALYGAEREGVFITSQSETAQSFAEAAYGDGRALGPGVVKIEVPASEFGNFAARNGIAVETPIVRPLAGGQTETLLPFHTLSEFYKFATFSHF
jgi:hypothetical protein